MLAQKLLGLSDADGGNPNPADVFSTNLYTGTGATKTIANGVDLSGNGGLVWTRCRSISYDHVLCDTGRGVTKNLSSAGASAQATVATGLTAFNGSGYVLGAYSDVNATGETFVSWTFRKAAKFFDVVTYTGNGVSGRAIAHSLGVAPGMVITKGSSVGRPWRVWHQSLAAGNYLALHETAIPVSDSTVFTTTPHTSTSFYVGNAEGTNESGTTYVAYLFATLPGISKVGTYTGNGSSQAINCGFSTGARFVLIKRTDATGDWYVWDTSRGIVSGNDPHSSLNSNLAEVTTDDSIDPDSTGFIVNQVAATNVNVNAASYIFLSIA